MTLAVSLISYSALVRSPDDFVLLDLKTHGQGVGNDFFGKIAPGNRSLPRRDFLQGGMLLLRREGMHPGKQQRTDGRQVMVGKLLPGPRVILHRADDKFDLIGGLQM